MTETEDFTKWLNQKLQALNTDESVFGSYIMGILEGDETADEKREALEGILSEIIVSISFYPTNWPAETKIMLFVCRKMIWRKL